MNEPGRMVFWMGLLLAGVAAACVALFGPLRSAFEANEIFNGVILAVLLIGIVINFVQVTRLTPATQWIADVERNIPPGEAPSLIASLARMLASGGEERVRLSAIAMRSMLDGVRLGLDESRDIARYMVGLLIFLGLLGTFWGLLDTVRGVGEVISGISAGSGDMSAVFDELKRQLQGPLAGMGTAFSSSLFGLSGALVLGLLDLQAGHAQNRFYNRLEQWLSSMAQLPSGTLGLDGEHSVPAYIEALLRQTADNLNELQRAVSRNEEERRATHTNLNRLGDQIAALTDQLRGEQKLRLSLAKSQMDLQPTFVELTNQMAGSAANTEQMRDHLRSADVALARLVDEVAAARAQVPDELRKEIRLLAQSLART